MAEALMEELVEEILLRLPADDPASLLRAATVCRRWCRVMSAPDFRRKFAQRHRAAPLLGFLANNTYEGHLNTPIYEEEEPYSYNIARFVPAAPFRFRFRFRPPRAELRDRCALDVRHGRVLLAGLLLDADLEVWDPFTDELLRLPTPPVSLLPENTKNAAVVCAGYADGACNHLDCRHGPFLVVLLDNEDASGIRAHVYSLESATWSEPAYGPPPAVYGLEVDPAALVGNALCFLMDGGSTIVEYDLATQSMSLIRLPPELVSDLAVLATTVDGGLGFARLTGTQLFFFSSVGTGTGGDTVWAKTRSIEIEALLQAPASSIRWLGFAHGVGVVFAGTLEFWFRVDLDSGQVTKEECGDGLYLTEEIVPYTSFYVPDLHQYGVAPV